MLIRSGALVCWVVWIVGAAGSAANADESPAPEKTLSPYFFVPGGDPEIDRLPLESTNVDFAIAGSIADVTVEQRYRNTGERPINARYVFPASTRAAVHGMTMRLGDRVIVATIRERQRARREFEQAKKAGKTATLLEQDRPNVFSMNVANILPGDAIAVTLEYTERLVPTDGVYEWVFPTVVGPRYGSPRDDADRPKNQFVNVPYLAEGKPSPVAFDIGGTLSASMPIRELGSSSHRVDVVHEDRNFARVSLREEEPTPGTKDYTLRYRLAGETVQSGLSLYEHGDEKFFALVVEPPARVTPDAIPAREYVFVLDVSGSMHGFPLDTAKQVMRRLIEELRPVDRFNVVLFSGGSTLLSPRSLPATAQNLRDAVRAIDAERGGGGTELLSALQRALGLSNQAGLSRHFVVVTDGYVAADERVLQFVVENRGSANVHAFGIGSSVNRYLIEGLAEAGMGEPFVILEGDQARDASNRFFEYVSAPVLTDIVVEADGFEIYDVEPRRVPDVLAERPIVIHGKYRGARTGEIALTGVGGKGPFIQRFAPATVSPRAENEVLRYLWARTRIAALSGFGRGEPSAELRSQIVELGLTYNLLTRFTSFIAIAHVIRNPEGDAADVDQPLPLPQGVSNLAVGRVGIVAAPEPELWMVLCGAGLALAAARRTARRRLRRAAAAP